MEVREIVNLTGKTALVTGASGGIGASIARTLANAGAAVAVHCRSNQRAGQEVVDDILASGGDVWPVVADITRSSDVTALIETIQNRCGGLDILVNNAGAHVVKKPLEEIDDEAIFQVFQINLVGAIYVTRAALPLLRGADEASIVNVSSIAAQSGGSTGSGLYAAAKGGLEAFTRSMAKELAPRIRVNAVSPAAVPSAFHDAVTSEQRWEKLQQATPLKRLGRAEDTANVVLFLVGKGATYLTGQVIQVSGGRELSY